MTGRPLDGRELAEYGPIIERIAKKAAANTQALRIDHEDLEQVGYEALLVAWTSFDPTRSNDIRGHIIKTIQRRIIDYIRTCDALPHPTRRLLKLIDAAAQQLSAELGRTVTSEETAEIAGIDPNIVRTARHNSHRFEEARLDAPGPDGQEPLDIPDRNNPGPATPEEETAGIDALTRVLSRYASEREIRLFIAHHIHGFTPEDLAKLDPYATPASINLDIRRLTDRFAKAHPHQLNLLEIT